MKIRTILSVILIMLMALNAFTQVESSRDDKKSDRNKTRKEKKKVTKTETTENSVSLDKNEIMEIYEKLASGSEEVVQETPVGSVNWSEQFIEARGETVIDTVRFKNKAQARAMAVRGAVVVAQRNLLEIINGVKVHGETTVENMITTNDYIYTRVDGIIKGAQMIGEPKEEWGMMVVTLKAPLYQENGLASAVYDGVKEMNDDLKSGDGMIKVGEVSQEEAGSLETFVFEMGGKKFDPSLFPVVVDENNNVLLDLYKIYDPKQGKFPKVLQTTREVMNDLGIEKGVEIIDVVDSFDGKLVVSEEVKKKINWEKVLKTAATIGKALMLII
ncbi:MAG: hypothetical protein KDC05_01335 [Bacteroidales bacterium]|nr:hypothetical protein [Bacteroidales bacterium]